MTPEGREFVLQKEKTDSEMGYVPTKAELAAPTESASNSSIHTSSEKQGKKEPAGSLSPKIASNTLATLTDSKISISNLLKYVNEYFPDILPESVLRHFGHNERPNGKLGESALFSANGTAEMAALEAQNNKKNYLDS